MSTKIQWTEETWNPVTGCSKVSAGCENCYAMHMAHRLSNIASTRVAYEGTTRKTEGGLTVWTGKINLVPDKLTVPLKRKKPTMYFVNSMSDLFHEDIPFDYIDKVFAVMALCPQHIFQVLTKRPERMREYMTNPDRRDYVCTAMNDIEELKRGYSLDGNMHIHGEPDPFPLKQVWLGVSVEDQKTADERIPILLDTPASVRWISAEPLLGNIDLKHLHGEVVEIDCLNGTHGVLRPHGGKNNKLDQVIVGGESGSNARPSHPDWFRSLRDQCKEVGIPFFFKQFGSFGASGENITNGLPTFRSFKSIDHWVSKASGWLRKGDVCIDMTGKVCKIGSDFSSATYPIAIVRPMNKKAAGRMLDGKEYSEFPLCTQLLKAA